MTSRHRLCVAAAWACAAVLAGAAPASANPGAPPADTNAVVESDEQGTTYWSRVVATATVRLSPAGRSRSVGKLRPETFYGVREVVVVLKRSGKWWKVRYAGLGRKTGWVTTSALSPPQLTRSWVVIDRRTQILRAYEGERRVLTARVGVGSSGSPTPGGRFLIRERLVPANKRGIYGVLAFGLSAYSRHRTDWPGGGQVGIHGTNQPDLIPGRISNGCVRMRNVDVKRLDRVVAAGTPVRIQ